MKKSKNKSVKSPASNVNTEKVSALKVSEKEETAVAVKPIEETAVAVKPIEETAVAVKPIEETAVAKIKPAETKIVVKKEDVSAEKAETPANEVKAPEVKAEETNSEDEKPKKATKPRAKKPVKVASKTTSKATPKEQTKEQTKEQNSSSVDEASAEAASPAPIQEEPPAPKFKVAIVGSECAPFAKTGGLADVIGALPKALNALDVEVSVFIPFHKIIKDKYRLETQHMTFFYINLGWRTKFVGVEKLVRDNITYYFIDNEDYFGGPIYLGQQPEGEQYAFFTRAVLEAMLHMDYTPNVIHVNDWQTAMLPMLLKTQYQATALNGTKSLLTIHNMMYQGMYGFEFVQSLLGIDARYYTPEFMEANGCANFMKGGLVFADKISTVSPTYALELKDPYYANGLEGILNARAHDTVGILNGIDTDENNPQTDTHIPVHFSKEDLSGKLEDKRILMEKLGLHFNKETPLIGMVSRLTSQKGFDLIKSIFHELMTQNVSIVLLGTGDKEYEAFFGKMENEYKGRVCSYIGYNNEVAHQIYAGCDLFLMPSKFEPCGISQMLAQRYGALPIARETGGLKDTVIPFNEYTGEGTGFTFTNYNSHDMLDIIKYALYCFNDKNKRACLIKNAMECDNSFAVSAQKYLDLYKSL